MGVFVQSRSSDIGVRTGAAVAAGFAGRSSSMADTSAIVVETGKPQSVLNRAWSQIARTVREIGPRRRGVEITLRPELPESDESALAQAFQECVEHRGGEVRARGRAAADPDALDSRQWRGLSGAPDGSGRRILSCSQLSAHRRPRR